MPRVSSWRYTVFSLLSHTTRERNKHPGGPRPPAGPPAAAQSPRRRASSRVRRWSPPPGQASTPQSCRTTAGQNETRLAAPPPCHGVQLAGIARGKYGGKTARAGAHAPTAAKKGSRVFYAGVCAGQFICLPRGSTGERGCGMQDISCVRARAQSPMPKKLYKFYTLYTLLSIYGRI